MIEESTRRSLQGRIAFPEFIERLSGAGVERYHVDLTRNETTYYLPDGASHVLPLDGPDNEIAAAFAATGVEAAVRAAQRGDIVYPEFLARIRAAGCVGYFTQINGCRVQYVGRTGDSHIEPFPAAT